jgi:type I restriction enzyme R subunit
MDRNAVQTVSRLNRKIEGKSDVVVVDFTNNAAAILKAFAKYRKGTPFDPDEPDPAVCTALHAQALAAGLFTQDDAQTLVTLAATDTDAQLQFAVSALRVRFLAHFATTEDRKAYVHLLARLVKSFHFLRCFFTFVPAVATYVAFAEVVGPQLIKQGGVSDLMKLIRQTEVVKAAVEFRGEVRQTGAGVKLRPGSGKKGVGPPLTRSSLREMLDDIRAKYVISDDEALYIKEVTEEKVADPAIRDTVVAHKDDQGFLQGAYRGQVDNQIRISYDSRGRYDELADEKYTGPAGIFHIMAVTVIQTHLGSVA